MIREKCPSIINSKYLLDLLLNLPILYIFKLFLKSIKSSVKLLV